MAIADPIEETPAEHVPEQAPIEAAAAARIEPEPEVAAEPIEEDLVAAVEPVEAEPAAAVETVEPEPIGAVEPEPTAVVDPEPIVVIEPEPIPVVEAVEPEPAVSVREPYEYAIIDHESEAMPAADIDEINPAKPADHTIISGGELAQERAIVEPEMEIEALPPVENEIAAATPVVNAIPELIEIPSTPAVTETATPPSETVAVMEDDAKLIVADEAPAVAAAPPLSAPVTVGTREPQVMGASPFPAPKETKQGLFSKLKDAIGGDDSKTFTSRAPGSTPDPRYGSSEKARPASADELKLALAREAESRPIPDAPTVDEAKQALAAGEYRRAAAMFLALAENGDAQAQAHIGYMTYQGEGVTRDRGRAVDWYRRAAVQGNRDAQYNLAVAYAFGEGVPQDDAEAVVWYRRAAEQGSAISQYSLGVSYALGEGVEQSDATAATWYREAAEQGYPPAQYNLAYMHRAGKGINQDDAEALKWYLAAAKSGHASAQYSLGYMYRSGKGVARNVDEAIR